MYNNNNMCDAGVNNNNNICLINGGGGSETKNLPDRFGELPSETQRTVRNMGAGF